MGQNPNSLYDKLINSPNEEIDFWGGVPSTFSDVITKIKAQQINTGNYDPNRHEKLNKLTEILEHYHKKLGIYSPRVKDNLAALKNGSVLVGQQPIIFGGPGFIGNKFGALTFIHNELVKQDLDLAPIFFVGDYDNLQKELTRVYLPNPISHQPFIVESEGYLPEESSIAAHGAKLPPYSWLTSQLDRISDNFGGFVKKLKGEKKKIFHERWAHIKTLIKTSFVNSNTLSEWSTRLWGTIINVINDYGIIFFPTSFPEIRELIYEQYYPLITNRALYAAEFQSAIDNLEALEYQPTLSHRHSNYSPFMLECDKDSNRIPTTIEERNGKLFAEGICPSHKELHSYPVNNVEELKSISTMIGPRVDTSQVIFQKLLDIKIRISGPGEIAYYAQVVKGLKSLEYSIPIFVKYKRAFYGSNAIEELGKLLHRRNQATLQTPKLFELLKARVQAVKSENILEIKQAESDMTDFILHQYHTLLNSKASIDRDKYLGWQYGRFDKNKFGQEVSWVWIDLALQTGLEDYIATYQRMYTTNSSVGGYFFINSLI